jgi:uncharacterized protein with HEPN domain
MPSDQDAARRWLDDIFYPSTWRRALLPVQMRHADAKALADDLLRLYVVTRCLEIISEASRRLPDDLKARHPSIAWKEMAAAGNVYRHEYEGGRAAYVADTPT